MAKRKTSSSKISLKGLLLVVLGASIYGLAFLPMLKVTNTLTSSGSFSQNLYNMAKGLTIEGERSAGILVMQITSLVALIVAGIAVIAGLLVILKVIKDGKMASLICFGTLFVLFLVYTICYFSLSQSLKIVGITISFSEIISKSTLVYIPLGVSLAGLAFGALSKAK